MPDDEPIDLSVGAPGAPELDAALDDELADSIGAEFDLPPVDEAQTKRVLAAIGGGIGSVVGDPTVEGHWHFTADELDGIAPPLTAAINRNRALKRAVHDSDLAVVAAWLGAYGFRNVKADTRPMPWQRKDTTHDDDEPAEARPAEGRADPPAAQHADGQGHSAAPSPAAYGTAGIDAPAPL